MKIPFERTIAGAYRFAFRNILSIIGIGWFPYLLFCLFVAGLAYMAWPQIAELASAFPNRPDPAKGFAVMRLFLMGEGLVLPALLVTSAMVTVGIMRKALGQHPGPVFIFFSLGGQVLRLIATYFLVVVLAIGMMIALGAVVGLAVAGLQQVARPFAEPVGIFLGIAAFVWFVYAFVRLSFFLPAVVVAENHIGIRRAWHLGRGNFWRIVGISLIVSIPLNLAAQTLESSILQMVGGSLVLQPGASPADLRQFVFAWIAALKVAWPYLAGVVLLHMTIAAGLSAGAIANAYNLVTGGDDIAPPPAKAPA